MTNIKQTKKALLCSSMALILCFTMLLGTTFAWFTDTASTNVNTIQAGTLDVALEMYENGEWVSAEGKTLNFVAKDGNKNILWEPGCTYETVQFRVVNKGNLALKYKFVISGINGDAKLNDAIDWTYDYIFANGSSANYPLTDLTSAQTVLKPDGVALSDYEARGFKIVGHMDEGAGNEYQGLSIEGISITVIATQAQYESDSNNNQYDKDAEYPIYVPVGGLDTAADSENVTTIKAGGLFNDEISNAYVIENGTYWAQKDFATFNNTYSTIWINDVDVSCKTLLCALKANNTIVLSDCNITIADGGHLVEELSGAPTQVIFANVTINGEKVTNSNFNSMMDKYCTGESIWGFVLY